MITETPKQVTFNGKTYQTDSFSANVQQLIGITAQWQADLTEAKLLVMKNETALQVAQSQLSKAIEEELARPIPTEVSAEQVAE